MIVQVCSDVRVNGFERLSQAISLFILPMTATVIFMCASITECSTVNAFKENMYESVIPACVKH